MSVNEAMFFFFNLATGIATGLATKNAYAGIAVFLGLWALYDAMKAAREKD